MATRKKPAGKSPAKKTSKTKKTIRKSCKKTSKRKIPLIRRRPKVTAEEKLYLLFKDDYEARQVFAYLRVDTVGQLEQYAPAQIVDLLTQPLQKTVERVRTTLAEKYRCLNGDEKFLNRHLERESKP